MTRTAAIAGLFWYAALLLTPVPAAAKPIQAAGQQQQKSDDIIVTGHTKKEVQQLIQELTPWNYDRQIGRWNSAICVRVVGLDKQPEEAGLIRTRIETAARSVDISIDTANDCVGNIRIIFTDYADALTKQMIQRYPELLKDVERFGLPHRKDTAPLLKPRAVRWFTVTSQADIDEGDYSLPLQRIDTEMPSRITEATRENTIYSYVIIDNGRLSHVKWGQLADYLSMVALAHPDIGADYRGEDTILAIFSDRNAGLQQPTGLTIQDRSFLQGLYRSASNKTPAAQRNEILRRMLHGSPPR